MTPAPRLLAIMGSGETSPTMVTAHQDLIRRVGGPAVLLDTPFGFQENAAELATRAVQYFRDSVGAEIGVVSFRGAGADGDARDDVGPLERETALARLREAAYVFAGPGSPSYALRQWRETPIPDLLRQKLERGGCVTFASAAALTLGCVTVPVYEIYKVGEEPRWLEGLDLLGASGLRAAVIPHYDNAEGGTHDTRFCYLGERRLAHLEASLPPGCFVLGVDEHTACVLDLAAGTASVSGRGVVTVRRAGRSAVIPAGTTVAIEDLERLAGEASAPSGGGSPAAPERADVIPGAPASSPKLRTPLMEALDRAEGDLEEALSTRDAPRAVRVILDLDAELLAWSADTLQSDEPDRVRASLRSMIVRLGELVEPLEPYVALAEELRATARRQRDWATADAIRDRLVALGVEVRDAGVAGREGAGEPPAPDRA